jgi:hypothetical protein
VGRWGFLALLLAGACTERALRFGRAQEGVVDLSVADPARDGSVPGDGAAVVDGSVDLSQHADASVAVDLATTDGALPPGLAWRTIPSGTMQKLHTAWASSANDVWVVGYAFLHGTGDPISFSTVSVPGHGFGIWGTSAADFWVAGRYVNGGSLAGVVFEGTGSPTTFTNTPSLNNWGLYAMWAQSPESLWAVGDNGEVAHGQGAPMSWSTVAYDNFGNPFDKNHLTSAFGGCRQMFAVWGTGDEIWAVGSQEGVLHGGNDPTAWTLEHGGGGGSGCSSGDIDYYWGADLRGIWGASTTDLWAVGHDGLILHGTGGATWTPVDSGTIETLTSVWGASMSDVWAVGTGGTILHGSGSPLVWTAVPSGTSNHLYGVWGRTPTDLWAVGAYGTILHYSE